jgi:hypothetical protein
VRISHILHWVSETGNSQKRSTTEVVDEGFVINRRRHEDDLQRWVSFQELSELEQEEIAVDGSLVDLKT